MLPWGSSQIRKPLLGLHTWFLLSSRQQEYIVFMLQISLTSFLWSVERTLYFKGLMWLDQAHLDNWSLDIIYIIITGVIFHHILYFHQYEQELLRVIIRTLPTTMTSMLGLGRERERGNRNHGFSRTSRLGLALWWSKQRAHGRKLALKKKGGRERENSKS